MERPFGVIKAFYDAKTEIADLQLILAGFLLAQDDPEAKRVGTRRGKKVRRL